MLIIWSLASAKLLVQIIKLRARCHDYTIKSIRLDNASEFTFRAFDNYCMSIGTSIEYSIAHVHTKNDLVELFIIRLIWN